MFTKETLANPTDSVAHCHCPTIALAPGGDLLVAWYAYPQEETRGGMLVFSRKRAGSSRFEPPRRILLELNRSLGNPVLFCGQGGRTHLLFVALSGSYWDSAILSGCYSDDLGTTWSQPELLRLPEGTMVRHSPIACRNGHLLLPAYDEKTGQTVLLTAGPQAGRWTEVQRFDDRAAIQGSVVRQGDQQLCLMLRPSGQQGHCLRSVSGDDGRTWSRVMPTPLPNPLSGLAAFQSDEFFCTVYNHTTEHRRYPLSMSYSTDRGVSWSDPVHIDRTPCEVSYPAFIADGSGVVHGVYSFGRHRIRYVKLDSDWWMK